jgi:hypothetical protein
LSSGEGLVERVKDPEPSEGDGMVFSMLPEQRLLCYESEFARPITAMRREGNTLSPLIRAAWDGETLDVLTRGKSRLRASNAHLSIVAHVTREELNKLLSQSVEVANGFANRFLWCLVRRTRRLPFGGNMSALDSFSKPLADALARAKGIGEVTLKQDAMDLWDSVFDELSRVRAGAFGKATGRVLPQVMRLALVYALLDGSDSINADHLGAALAVWRYCEASARLLFGEGVDKGKEREQMPLALRLADAIAKTPGINRKGLYQAMGGHIKADDMSAALAWLKANGLAHPCPCKGEGAGRPPECWVPGPEPTPPDEGDGDGDGESDASERTDSSEGESNANKSSERINSVRGEGEGEGGLIRSFVLFADADADADADAQTDAGINSFARTLKADAQADAQASTGNNSLARTSDADADAQANAKADAQASDSQPKPPLIIQPQADAPAPKTYNGKKWEEMAQETALRLADADLRTSPTVTRRADRMPMLEKLIAVHINRGEKKSEVMFLADKWNDRLKHRLWRTDVNKAVDRAWRRRKQKPKADAVSSALAAHQGQKADADGHCDVPLLARDWKAMSEEEWNAAFLAELDRVDVNA